MEPNECINKNGGIIIGQTNGNDKPNCDSGDDGKGLPLNNNNNNNNNNKKDDSCTELDHANRIFVDRKVVFQTNINSMVNSDSTATDIAEMSLMQDSSSELQWCTELDYHYQSERQLNHSCQKSIFEGSLIDSTSEDYITPPSVNYDNISKNIDANLAQIDMETFRAQDINDVFQNNHLYAESKTCDESISMSSLDGLSLYGKNEELFHSSKKFDTTTTACRLNDDDSKENHLQENTISIDSLDQSFENNTNELLIKCAEKDKEKYTIAFEGSMMTDSHGFSDFDQKSDNSKNQLYKHHLSSLQTNTIKNITNELIRSEYQFTTWNRLNKDDHYNCNVNLNHESIDLNTKSTLSLPNIKSIVTNRQLNYPYGFLPLYDLHGSQSTNSHSSCSELSPPRSLVKMFIQNRQSPSSSGQVSLCMSSNSYSQASNESQSSTPVYPFPYNNTLRKIRETNNNITYTLDKIQAQNQKLIADDTIFEDSLIDGHHTSQTKPVINGNFNIKKINSTAKFNQTKKDNRISIDLLNDNLNLLRNKETISGAIKENSYSSGYVSSKHGSELIKRPNQFNCNKSISLLSKTTTRTIATQIPVHIQDKKIQASLLTDSNFIIKNNNKEESKHNLNPIQHSNKQLYVYYPNYSLPDLSFLHNIPDKLPQVFLSPLTHQMPKKESVSVEMRKQTGRKARPKSYTDFETLSKQNFNHIKDWDSLDILLPNEFKELIEKLKLVQNPNFNNGNDENYDQESSPIVNGVKLRSQKRGNRVSSNQESQKNYHNGQNQNYKRYSLQEPTPIFIPANLNKEFNVTRSTTMPDCHHFCHQQTCHQHYNCCHSCCHTPCCSPQMHCLSPLTPTKNGFPMGFSSQANDILTNSIDRLCQLFAMDLSFKKMISLINGKNDVPAKNYCEPVVEVNEDCDLENVTESMVYDKPNGTNQEKEDSTFKELKQRWEAMFNNYNKTEMKNDQMNKAQPKVSDGVVLRRPKLGKSDVVRPKSFVARPTSLVLTNIKTNRKSMIPVPKSGSIKSPTSFSSKNALPKSRLPIFKNSK